MFGLAAIACFSLMFLQDSRISHLTHLLGMITGYIYLNWNLIKWKIKAMYKLNHSKNFIRDQKNKKTDNKLIQKRVDIILDKLSDEGWEKLTDTEQKILYRASEEYSRRDQPN